MTRLAGWRPSTPSPRTPIVLTSAPGSCVVPDDTPSAAPRTMSQAATATAARAARAARRRVQITRGLGFRATPPLSHPLVAPQGLYDYRGANRVRYAGSLELGQEPDDV